MGFILPEEQRFECGSCTRCCRGDWTIHVDPHTWHRLQASACVHELAVRDGVSPLVTEDPADAAFTTHVRMHCGTCVFLDRDGLCGMHRALGHSAKPGGCRLFPFILQPTPDGVYVGLSFFCSAVQANSGNHLEEHVAELGRLLGEQHFPRIGSRIILHEDDTITWDEYLDVEAALAASLQSSPTWEGVWAGVSRVFRWATARQVARPDGQLPICSVPTLPWDEVTNALLRRHVDAALALLGEGGAPPPSKDDTTGASDRGARSDGAARPPSNDNAPVLSDGAARPPSNDKASVHSDRAAPSNDKASVLSDRTARPPLNDKVPVLSDRNARLSSEDNAPGPFDAGAHPVVQDDDVERDVRNGLPMEHSGCDEFHATLPPDFERYLRHLLFRKYIARDRTILQNVAAWLLAASLLERLRVEVAREAGRAFFLRTDAHHALTRVEREVVTHTRQADGLFAALCCDLLRLHGANLPS